MTYEVKYVTTELCQKYPEANMLPGYYWRDMNQPFGPDNPTGPFTTEAQAHADAQKTKERS